MSVNEQAAQMQMKRECIQRVSLALGRQITEKEAAEILAGIRAGMTKARQSDPGKWAAMSKQERADAGAKFYADSMKEEAALIKKRAALTVVVQDQLNRRMEFHRARGYHGLAVTQALLEDGNRHVNAVRNEYLTQFCAALNGKIPGFMGLFEDKRFARQFIREIYGQDSGSGLAKLAAKTFTEVSEAERQRLNANGGNLGKLDHYFPQSHDVVRMSHAAEVLAGQGRLRQIANMAINTVTKGVNTHDAN